MSAFEPVEIFLYVSIVMLAAGSLYFMLRTYRAQKSIENAIQRHIATDMTPEKSSEDA